MRNGAVEEIIPTGTELPYSSPILQGFSIQPGQDGISFPIRRRDIDGSYRTIANSTIRFSNNSKKIKMVDIKINMDTNKVITMNAWTYDENDEDFKKVIGTVEIVIDNTVVFGKKSPGKITPPKGSKLDPKAEIDSLIMLCNNFEKTGNNKNNVSTKLKSAVSTICSCTNPNDFAPVIISSFRNNMCNEAKLRLFIISRHMMKNWTEKDKKSIASYCMSQISKALNGIFVPGKQRNTDIQAIYTLGFCGSKEQLKRLEKLHDNSKYYQGCLYAHGMSQTSQHWLAENFFNDAKAVENGRADYLQFTSYAIALSLRENNNPELSKKEIIRIIKKLIHLISLRNLTSEKLINCVLSLGWICDSNNVKAWGIDSSIIDETENILEQIEELYNYSENIITKSAKTRSIAKKLINGQKLSDDDERFLLEKINIFDK
jgi:NADPH-dependent 7-cyano-7-deazaguanine reductase QueF